jgi:hypothetical protein
MLCSGGPSLYSVPSTCDAIDEKNCFCWTIGCGCGLLLSSMKWLAEERCGADGEEVRLKAEVARKELLADRVEMGVEAGDGQIEGFK